MWVGPHVLHVPVFGALDPQTRWGMQGAAARRVAERGQHALLVTHNVSEAVYLADTV